MNDDFTKVVGVSGPREEADRTDLAFISRVAAEIVFLHVGNAFHDEADGEENHPGDVATGAKIRLVKFGDVGGVEDCDGEGDGPDPDHLEDPKPKKGEELVSDLVEAVVFPRLEDSEEEEGREAGAPQHDEEGDDDLARMVVTGKGKTGGVLSAGFDSDEENERTRNART